VLDTLARGCIKPLSLTGLSGLAALTTSPGQAIVVPPDRDRGFADRPAYKALHATGRQSDAHGFAFVDRTELELMDNRDATLSIFGTLIDHGASLATPAPGTPAASFGPGALAALGREFSYNDPQVGVKKGAEGRPRDRNVELLLDDPRAR
jgi:hypothetical protein